MNSAYSLPVLLLCNLQMMHGQSNTSLFLVIKADEQAVVITVHVPHGLLLFFDTVIKDFFINSASHKNTLLRVSDRRIAPAEAAVFLPAVFPSVHKKRQTV